MFFIKLADEMKQQRAAGCREWQIASSSKMTRRPDRVAWPDCRPCQELFPVEQIDQVDRIGESYAFGLADPATPIAVAKWVFPVPVPPTRIRLCAVSIKAAVANCQRRFAIA